MRKRSSLWLLAVITIAAALGVSTYFAGKPASSGRAASIERQVASSGAIVEPESPVSDSHSKRPSKSAPDESASVALLQQSREAVAASAVTFRVVDERNAPIGNVLATCDPLNNDINGFHNDPALTDWLFHDLSRTERILGRRVSTVSASNGDVRFDALPGSDEGLGWVIWLSHESYAPSHVLVGPDAILDVDSPIVLGSRERFSATVESGIESSLEGTLVFQQALLERDEVPGLTGSPRQLRRALIRVHECDAAGRAALHSMDGPQVVWATTPDGRSSPAERLSEDRDATLHLGSTLQVEGRVQSTDGSPLGPWAMVVISAQRGESDEWERLGSTPASTHDGFGPLQIAVSSDQTKYSAHLVAGENVRVGVEFAPPSPGEDVYLNLEFQAGTRRWFEVFDASIDSGSELPNGIGDALIELRWALDDERVGGVDTRTIASGHAQVQGIPIGHPVDGVISAEGFGDYQLNGRYFDSQAPNQSEGIPLWPVSSVSGHVTRSGEPVEDFTILAYDPRNPEWQHEAEVSDSVDGSFELGGFPTGPMAIMALADHVGISDAIAIDIGSDTQGPIELELVNVFGARGKVIDGRSNEPVSGEVYPVIMSKQGDFVKVMEPFTIDSDGEYSFIGAGPLGTHANVVADGYETAFVSAAPSNGPVDFGTQALSRQGRLDVRLANFGALDPTQCSLALWGESDDARRNFDAQGQLSRNFFFGTHKLVLVEPSGSTQGFMVECLTEPPWSTTLDLARDNRLRIDFIDDRGLDLEVLDGDLFVAWTNADGVLRTILRPLPSSASTYTVFGPDEGDVYVHVDDARGRHVKSARLSGDEEESIDLVINEDFVHYMLVDTDSLPVHPGRVSILQSIDGRLTPITQSTAVDGSFRIDASRARSSMVGLFGSNGEFAAPIMLAIEGTSTADTPHQVVLDTSHFLEASFTCEGRPAQGVETRIWDASHSLVFALEMTDQSGVASFGPASTGQYIVEAASPGYLQASTQVSIPSSRIELIVERMVGINVSVKNIDGTAAASATVDFMHERLGESFSEWIDQGRVRAELLTTNSEGVLSLSDFPTGSYIATVSLGERWTEQRIEVSSDNDNEFVLTLGD